MKTAPCSQHRCTGSPPPTPMSVDRRRDFWLLSHTPGEMHTPIPPRCFTPEIRTPGTPPHTHTPLPPSPRLQVTGPPTPASLLPLSLVQGTSYVIFPERCFPLALPEFHVLCASGAVGEDKRSLDGALSKLGAVGERKRRGRVIFCRCCVGGVSRA